MSKVIIGIPNNGGSLRTNLPTSEKYNCQALKDQEKKKKEQIKMLKTEFDRRDENE